MHFFIDCDRSLLEIICAIWCLLLTQSKAIPKLEIVTKRLQNINGK